MEEEIITTAGAVLPSVTLFVFFIYIFDSIKNLYVTAFSARGAEVRYSNQAALGASTDYKRSLLLWFITHAAAFHGTEGRAAEASLLHFECAFN